MSKGTSRLTAMKAQRESAGHSITSLAKKANVSDWDIRQIEAGGNVSGDVAQRIADALSISRSTLGEQVL